MYATLAVLVALAALATPAPAGAHACAAPVQVPVGERASVTVGVAAEAVAVTGVDVGVPEGFRLTGVPEAPGWRVERDGSTVRFREGEVAPFGCAYLTLEGVAERKGQLLFPLVVHTADGQALRYESAEPGDPQAAQLVVAGVDPGGAEGAGTRLWRMAGWALVVLGLVGAAAAYALRRLSPRPPAGRAARSGRGGPGRPGSGSSRSRSRTRKPPRRR